MKNGRAILEALKASFKRSEIKAYGYVDLDLALTEKGPGSYAFHLSAYRSWLEKNQNASMDYLRRGLSERENPRLIMPEAESVLTFLIPYSPRARNDAQSEVRFARYLQGPDYHDQVRTLSEELFSRVKVSFPEFKYRTFVDTSRVLERAWASLCGLGWIGKNGCLIHPRLGSYVFIAGAFMNLRTDSAPQRMGSRCGSCERCLKGCPTKAFLKARRLDARRCISYWTLEHRGSWPEEIRELQKSFSNWVAGCDLCQEVCPFNLKPEKQASLPEDCGVADFEHFSDWAHLSEADFRARVKNSAMKRIKYPDFRRNLDEAQRKKRESQCGETT